MIKNYVKYENEIYRIDHKKNGRMLYFKKISKTKNGKYTYVFVNGKRVNFDSVIDLIPQANIEQIELILKS